MNTALARWSGLPSCVRNAFEHGHNLAVRGGLGLASGPDGWRISYRDRMFHTKNLHAAAEDLHRAIRAAVDPEAFSDFRGDARPKRSEACLRSCRPLLSSA